MRRLLFAALALIPVVMSCSGDETAPSVKGPIPVQALRSESEAATCEFEVRCSMMPNDATCKDLDGADYELLQLIADVVVGKVHYDPEAGRKWVEAVRTRKCEAGAGPDKALKAVWDPVFTGTIKAGGSCFVDEECAGKNICDKTGCSAACCSGTCSAPPPPAAIGAECGGPVTCDDQAFCGADEGAGGSGGASGKTVCKPRAENGQPCVGQAGCQDGQLCDVAGTNKCYKLSSDNAQCNPALRYACIAFNRWCDPAVNKCVELPGAGQPCAATGEYCKGYAFCNGNACASKPVEGEKCTPDGVFCLGDLYCDGNVNLCKRRAEIEVCGGAGGGGGN